MKPIRTFDDLLNRFRSLPVKRRVAVVCPSDTHTVYVVKKCLDENLAEMTLICSSEPSSELTALYNAHRDKAVMTVVGSNDEAAKEAVRLVHEGLADIIMKGAINTDNLLRAVLNKENGLLPAGNIMTHATLIQVPAYSKLLLFSDAAVIPRPTLEQFDAMVRYDCAICRALGIGHPKVALTHFTEKVNAKFQHTVDYVEIKERAAKGAYGDIEIDGPMDIKTACDAHSAAVKGIGATSVPGDADILILPNLEAGNTFYKSVSFFGKALMAGVICGTSAPVVVPSRADSDESKFYSLALACVIAE